MARSNTVVGPGRGRGGIGRAISESGPKKHGNTKRGSSHRDEPDPKPGWVVLRCEEPQLNLEALLAPDPPIFDGGFEGWEIEPRPKSDAMTIWSGNTPLSMTLSIVLDGVTPGRDKDFSQTQNIKDLIRCARGGPDDTPGIVEIFGIPEKIFDEWVIEGLEFGDQIRRRDMHISRQFVTITLRQYIPPDFKRIRRGALYKPKRKTTFFKVTKNVDTPVEIAKKFRCNWKVLQKLNKNIRGPHQKLAEGIRVRVPVRRRPRKNKK